MSFCDYVKTCIPGDWTIVKTEKVDSSKTRWTARFKMEITTLDPIPEAAAVGIMRFLYSTGEAAAEDFEKRVGMAAAYVGKSVPSFLTHEGLSRETRRVNSVEAVALITRIWVFPGVSMEGGALVGLWGNTIDIIYGSAENIERIAGFVINRSGADATQDH